MGNRFNEENNFCYSPSQLSDKRLCCVVQYFDIGCEKRVAFKVFDHNYLKNNNGIIIGIPQVDVVYPHAMLSHVLRLIDNILCFLSATKSMFSELLSYKVISNPEGRELFDCIIIL